tara:strand:+ start:2956 stop:3642 length:687 start_codon:yes stop_codon:yes gene_type:complete
MIIKKGNVMNKFIYPNVLPVGSAVLGGMPKLGKSFLALSIAKEVVESGKNVSIFSFEDNQIRANYRLKLLGYTAHNYDRLKFMTRADIPDLKGYDFIDMFEQYMNEMKHDLYVIDPIIFIQLENVPPNNYKKLYPFYRRFSELAHEHDCSILLITDVTKGKNRKIIGGKALTDATDTIIYAKKHGNRGIALEVTGKDIRYNEPIYYDRQLNTGFIFDNFSEYGGGLNA